MSSLCALLPFKSTCRKLLQPCVKPVPRPVPLLTKTPKVFQVRLSQILHPSTGNSAAETLQQTFNYFQ